MLALQAREHGVPDSAGLVCLGPLDLSLGPRISSRVHRTPLPGFLNAFGVTAEKALATTVGRQLAKGEVRPCDLPAADFRLQV